MTNILPPLSRTTIILHWLVGLAMIAMLGFGLYLEDLPRGAEKAALVGIHGSVGITVFVFAVWRLLWRWRTGFPDVTSNQAHWQNVIARIVHIVLLAGTVLMPLSGLLMQIASGNGLTLFGIEIMTATGERLAPLERIGHIMHGLGGRLLILAVLIHVAGALKHHVIDRDGILRRMLGAPTA